MTISVVIPVLHEGARINRAIGHLEGMASGSDVEIIVVDGSPGAETVKAIEAGNAKGLVAGKGRGRQMNEGAAAARGDVLLFLHADTELPEGGFDAITRTMESGRFVGGAFDLGIDDRGRAFRIIERVSSLRSRLTRVPYGDQAIFFLRDYFLEIGGYREIPLMEDVELMGRVKKRGGRISFIGKRVMTSSRRWRKEGIVACTLRNWTIMTLYLVGIPPEKLAKWYD